MYLMKIEELQSDIDLCENRNAELARTKKALNCHQTLSLFPVSRAGSEDKTNMNVVTECTKKSL